MTETQTKFPESFPVTPEIQLTTMSDRQLLLHVLQHAEDTTERLIELRAELADARAKIDAMHAELESARPLLERWTHSKVAKLAAGFKGMTTP